LIRPQLDELIAGIERFLEHPADFVNMAQRAHERVMEQFCFDARTEQLTKIYESLVRGAA
jgi:spore maturation protein CgeB